MGNGASVQPVGDMHPEIKVDKEPTVLDALLKEIHTIESVNANEDESKIDDTIKRAADTLEDTIKYMGLINGRMEEFQDAMQRMMLIVDRKWQRLVDEINRLKELIAKKENVIANVSTQPRMETASTTEMYEQRSYAVPVLSKTQHKYDLPKGYDKKRVDPKEMLRKELEEKEREMKKMLDLKKSFSAFEELRMKMEFAVLKCRNLNIITVDDINNIQETLRNLLSTENHKEELNEVIHDLEKKLEDLKEIQRQEQIKSNKERFEQMNLASKDLLQKHENGNECSLLEIKKMIKSINELVSKYQHDKDLQCQVEALQTEQIKLIKVNKNLEVKGCSDEIHELLLIAKGMVKNSIDGKIISIQEIDNMMQSIDKLFNNKFKKHKHDLQERFDELNSEKAKLSQVKRNLILKEWEHTIVKKNLEIQKLVDMHENGTHCPLQTINRLSDEITTLLRQVPRCQELETVITDLETEQNRLSDVREREEERLNEKKQLQLNTIELKDLISNTKNAIDALVRNKSVNSLSEIENIILQIDEYLNSLDYKKELQILINELKALQTKAEMEAKKRQEREDQERQHKEDKERLKEAKLSKEKEVTERRRFEKEQAELKKQGIERKKQMAEEEFIREQERKRLIVEEDKRKKVEIDKKRRIAQEDSKRNELEELTKQKEKLKEKQENERLQKEKIERQQQKEKKLQEQENERKRQAELNQLNQDRRKENEIMKDEEIKQLREREHKLKIEHKRQIADNERRHSEIIGEINVEKDQELQRLLEKERKGWEENVTQKESEKQELKILLNKLEKQIEEQLLKLDLNELIYKEDIEQNRKHANELLEQEIVKGHLIAKEFETETQKYKDVERSLNDNILKLQEELDQHAKNKDQFENSQCLKNKQMEEKMNELMDKWQELETEDFRIKQEKSLLNDEKHNFATEKIKTENEWKNRKQSEEDEIKRKNDALIDKSLEIKKQLDELAIEREAVDERMRAINDGFEFQEYTKDKNTNQSVFPESNCLKYTRGDDAVDDNLSYHKGNGCVITVDDETALGSDFVCDINPEFSSEFEGTVRIVPVKSISRPMSAAINIKHANKSVTNESGKQAVYIPHRATVTNEETSIYGAIDGGDWKEMDKAYSIPYNVDKLVDWIGTDAQFKSEASFIVVAKERFQLIKLDRFQKQEQSTVDDQVAINVHKDTFKTDTTMKLVVRLVQDSELGLCVKYHTECEHVTACSSLVTVHVGLSTREDMELWIKAKTKGQLSVVRNFAVFIQIGDCWTRAYTEWVETKPPKLVVTLPKSFQTYRIIGVKTVSTAEVNREIGRVIYEHTKERIVRLIFRQKKMTPTEAILVCARSDQTKHKCYELAKMGYTAGGLESDEFCIEDTGFLRVSFTGNVYCEQVERGSSFRLQFLSEHDVAVRQFTLYGVEGWLAPETDKKCISGKINIVRETEHEQTIMKQPVFLPK